MRPDQKLNELKTKNLFGPDGFLYSGVQDGKLKADLESRFVTVLDEFIRASIEDKTISEMLELLKIKLAVFDRDVLDTEDAENLAGNFEKIMDCIGLESSDGALNEWMYGFDPE